jgi:hypothetical protein
MIDSSTIEVITAPLGSKPQLPVRNINPFTELEAHFGEVRDFSKPQFLVQCDRACVGQSDTTDGGMKSKLL